MSESSDLARAVKALALEEGFAAVGVAAVGPVARAEGLRGWLARGWHGEMAYMGRDLSKRLDPTSLVPGARSVLSLAAAYGEGEPQPPGAMPPSGARLPASGACIEEETPRGSHPSHAGGAQAGLVARYARGRDYHRVLKARCRRLMDRLRRLEPAFAGRAFVDSAPVMERTLAVASGVGWIGKNGCLYVPGRGSYVLLCEVVSNLPLPADGPAACACDGCGACARACPTGAIADDGLVDARRCISYLTIEHRGEVPPEYWPRMGKRLFGCDRCQEACPHNRSLPPGEAQLLPERPPLGGAGLERVLAWSPQDWDAATRGSACRRASWEGFLRNAAIAAGNSRDPALLVALEDLRRRRPALAPIVEWAAARLARQRP